MTQSIKAGLDELDVLVEQMLHARTKAIKCERVEWLFATDGTACPREVMDWVDGCEHNVALSRVIAASDALATRFGLTNPPGFSWMLTVQI